MNIRHIAVFTSTSFRSSVGLRPFFFADKMHVIEDLLYVEIHSLVIHRNAVAVPESSELPRVRGFPGYPWYPGA